MNYPLHVSFKILALAHQFALSDANGQPLLYVKQQAFKLKEAIKVFGDVEQKSLLYEIKADRVLDFSGTYHFFAANGVCVGAVKRQGMKSLWRARYDVMDAQDRVVFSIREANPWIKVLDALLGEVPVLGLLTGYLFHPAYNVMRLDESVVLRVKKEAALFEGKFLIERLAPLNDEETRVVLLGAMMMLIFERHRG